MTNYDANLLARFRPSRPVPYSVTMWARDGYATRYRTSVINAIGRGDDEGVAYWTRRLVRLTTGSGSAR